MKNKIKSKDIKMIPISEVKPWNINRNKHSKDQISRLCKLIEYQGFRNPLVISNQTGLLIAGHARLECAKKLKMKEVPVIFQDFDNDDQAYAYMVSDNAIQFWSELDFSGINEDLGMFDPSFDIDLLGIENFTIDVADKELGDEEDTPEPPKESKVVRGEVYILGDHRLMNGDSTSIDDVEKLMAGKKVDLVLSDPPYGVDVVKGGKVGAEFGVAKKGQYKEIIGDDTTETAKEFYNTCVALGMSNMILWGGNYFTDFLPPSKSWVVWNKRGDTSIENTFADGEIAWSNLGHPVRIHKQLWNGMIRAGEKGQRVHPTQKPIDLAEYCINLKTDCKTIYDGFGGSGWSLIASEKLSKKCFMIEMDEFYCAVILDRWQKYTGNKAYRESDNKLWDEIKEGK